MSQAIVIQDSGGPEVLKLAEIDVPAPGPGQLRLRQTAIGVNFIDTYHRSGLYPVPRPFTPGLEAVGTVTALGPGVDGFKVGDRVAYGNGPLGAYAAERVIPAASVVKVPAALKDEQVAGMMLRGLTVWYLIRSLHRLQKGETVLFHAAAGGVGLLFCQWARDLGATVIGTVGSADKAALATKAGCHHVILYRQEDWVKKVREITGGAGVRVVYDGVGKDTFFGSLDCLAPRGLMCSFGNASGPPPPVEAGVLAAKGSLFFTRPRLNDYVGNPKDMTLGCEELFAAVARGAITVDVGQAYPLAAAAEAHRALEGRGTVGSTILKA
jgi:NADPH2:quinone reductase